MFVAILNYKSHPEVRRLTSSNVACRPVTSRAATGRSLKNKRETFFPLKRLMSALFNLLLSGNFGGISTNGELKWESPRGGAHVQVSVSRLKHGCLASWSCLCLWHEATDCQPAAASAPLSALRAVLAPYLSLTFSRGRTSVCLLIPRETEPKGAPWI